MFRCPVHPAERNTKMKLKIHPVNQYQVIFLGAAKNKQLWFGLFLDGERLLYAKAERCNQEEWNEPFNKANYNYQQRHDRHNGKNQEEAHEEATDDAEVGKGGAAWCEPLIQEGMDDLIFRQDERWREQQKNYDAVCIWVRQVLVKMSEIGGCLYCCTYKRRVHWQPYIAKYP